MQGKIFILLSFLTLLYSQSGTAQSGITYNTGKPVRVDNPSITGRVDFYRRFKSTKLAPRGIAVWLPPGYETDSLRHYPVLYMQDGQSFFNAETRQFKSDWHADETADSLIRQGKIEPLIIVAVNATLGRFREYTPSPKGEEYMYFLIHELKPVIDKNYRTLPEREHTAIGGSSAGGLIAFAAAWQNDSVYSKVISFSPAFELLVWDYTEYVQASPNKDLKMVFYHGGEGIEEGLAEVVDKMITILKSKGYKEGKDFIKLFGPEETHFGPGWGKYFGSALEFLFGKK